MMKRALLLLTTLLLSGVVIASGDGKTYGKGVSLARPVAVDALLANPEKYLGNPVRVDGVITGVCKMSGCWIQVSDPATGKGVRIKVEDGVIVFPPEAVGHRVSAQGVFEAQTVPAAPAGLGGHTEAQAGGPTCERSTVPKLGGNACDEPEEKAAVVYQIAGTGAVIY
jgi:hypothetical protein